MAPASFFRSTGWARRTGGCACAFRPNWTRTWFIRDGISLTIAALEETVLSVAVIPHTYRNTTLAGYRGGARVNIECDILAKHVEKLLRKLELKPALTVERLRDQGY
jgi:Lumazine binding domain